MVIVAPKHFILMEVLTFFGYFMWLIRKFCKDVSLEVKGCESVTCRCWPLTEDWIVLQYGLNVINRKYNIRCPKKFHHVLLNHDKSSVCQLPNWFFVALFHY